jgi:hypothetical protein
MARSDGTFDKSGSGIGTNRGHIMARLRWDISVSRAQWTRSEEVDSSMLEEVDSFWIVKGYNRKGGAMSFASSVGLGLISGTFSGSGSQGLEIGMQGRGLG